MLQQYDPDAALTIKNVAGLPPAQVGWVWVGGRDVRACALICFGMMQQEDVAARGLRASVCSSC